MSLIYRKERAEQGSINDPTPHRDNQNELAGEFNGYLDRYNLPTRAVGAASVVVGAFTTVGADPKSDSVALDSKSTTWQNDDGSGTYIHNVTFTASEDGQLDVDWGGTWTWTGNPTIEATIRWRITVNGQTIAETGCIAQDNDPTYVNTKDLVALAGTIPVQAGPVNIKVEAMIAAVSWYMGTTVGAPLFSITGAAESTVTVVYRELVYLLRSR